MRHDSRYRLTERKHLEWGHYRLLSRDRGAARSDRDRRTDADARDLAVEWPARRQEPGPGAGSGSARLQPRSAALTTALAREDAGQDVIAVRVVGSMAMPTVIAGVAVVARA